MNINPTPPITVLWLEFKQVVTYAVPFIIAGDKRELTDEEIVNLMDLNDVGIVHPGNNKFLDKYSKRKYIYEVSSYYDIKSNFSTLEDLLPV